MLDPKFDDFTDHREYGVRKAGPLPFSPLGFAYVLFSRQRARRNFDERMFPSYGQVNTGKSFEIPSLLAERLEHIDVLALFERAYNIATSSDKSMEELRQKVHPDSTSPVWEVPQDIFHKWLIQAACNSNQDGGIRGRNVSYDGTIVHLGGDNTKPWVGGEIVLLLAINSYQRSAMFRRTLFNKQDYWVHRWCDSRTPDPRPIQSQQTKSWGRPEEKKALLELVRQAIGRREVMNSKGTSTSPPTHEIIVPSRAESASVNTRPPSIHSERPTRPSQERKDEVIIEMEHVEAQLRA